MVTSKTTYVKTLIIGGGITGLATAYALEKQGEEDYAILEAKPVPGGLCATTFLNGYYFDYGGHFLHLHTPVGKAWVEDLLGPNLKQHTRNAFVYTCGMRVPVPFQTNLWALHPPLRALAEQELTDRRASSAPPKNFEEWCVRSFGYTLYEAFFRRYNEKLWGRPLSELTTEWCGPFIPAPSRQEILQSVHQKPAQTLGYNAQFYYPKTGGCGALIQALAARVKNMHLSTPLLRLDLAHKTAYTPKGNFVYQQVVNTLPLPKLVSLLDGQQDLKQAAGCLEAQAVTVYHLSIARRIEPFSWIYFPDKIQPFYRVGLTSAFAPDSIPHPDTSLFYIELPGLPPQTEQTEKAIWDGLYQKGIVDIDDVPLLATWQTIDPAYVIFNQKRAQTVPALLNALEQKHCYCAGRYGRWEYSFMESSLLQALELAHKLV